MARTLRLVVAVLSMVILLMPATAGAQSFCTLCARSGESGGGPVAVDDQEVFPSQARVIAVLANDVSPSGKALSVASVSGAVGGTAVVTAGGGSVTFTPAASATQGQFTYTVRDSANATDVGLATLVPQAAIPPVPGRTLDFANTCSGVQCTFTAMPSDRNGIRLYKWTFETNGTPLTGGFVTAFHAYSAAGTKRVTLAVTYADGQVLSHARDVPVPLALPHLTWTPDGGVVTTAKALRVTVNENLFPQRPGTRRYLVDWGTGNRDVLASSDPLAGQLSSARRYPWSGFFDVSIIVEETTQSGTQEFWFTKSVHIRNATPVASLVATQRAAPNDVVWDFDVSATQDDAIVPPLMTLYPGDGSTINVFHPYKVAHLYRLPGDYVVTLVATDDEGEVASASRTISVPNGQPIASFFARCQRLTCQFTNQSTDREATADPAGHALQYSWDFGDGSASSLLQTSHSFAAPGCYPVRLQTTDAHGVIDDGVAWVTVTDRLLTQTPETIVVDGHKPSEGTHQKWSDGNGIVEPNESVLLVPVFRNTGPRRFISGEMTIQAAPSPPGIRYSLNDGWNIGRTVLEYGTVETGALTDCWSNGRCAYLYVDQPSGTPRPLPHWDLTLKERESNGTDRLWSVHVGKSFNDVPVSHWAYAHVEALFHHGATLGCGNGNFCPDGNISRESLAVLLIRAMEPPAYQPPGCVSPPFNDVPCTNPNAPYVEQMKVRGITAGCGNGNYCPAGLVQRRHLATFLVAALGISPPACTVATYADVPCSDPVAAAVEELTRRGIMAGCGGNNFCPNGNVTRAQLAVFLVAAFQRDISFRICPATATTTATGEVLP